VKDSRIVSLKAARKALSRAEAKAEADANAARFGRTKAERVLEAARQEQARRRLDQHRLDES
jgi:hypothetical protein